MEHAVEIQVVGSDGTFKTLVTGDDLRVQPKEKQLLVFDGDLLVAVFQTYFSIKLSYAGDSVG